MKDSKAATTFSIYQTSAGFGAVVGNEAGLVAHHLPFGNSTASEVRELIAGLHPLAAGDSPLTAAAAGALEKYFAGGRVEFDFPLDLGPFTDFQKCVYRAVAAIPYGSVVSYGEVAASCGSPKGARAIGAAMARNPLPILIPCHRVVAATGGMTGFTAPGGVASKRELLRMEGAVLDDRGAVAKAILSRL